MFKIRVRAIVGIMIFLGYFLIYIVRYNLSVHIVDMAQLPKRDENMPITNNEKRKFSLYNWMKHNSARSMVDLISWDDMKMGKLFSAYHIGYCVCFPLFHNVGDRIGPTWVVGITGMISGILCCLTPAAAYYDFWVLFIVRIVEGFCAPPMAMRLRRLADVSYQTTAVPELCHWRVEALRAHVAHARGPNQHCRTNRAS
ncbi:hypothetical protein K1T71_009766 [Dendrolimus kikuchii]|uniref:Uncharacterized protein n=1 Tax=Dendrolimus kikuchii TaxID=765133 RepID=A0ACC1CSX7_9NEOP|nr:hypothetical protein K1T71_009766 [Dendrolimus kikuchii]